MTDGKIKVKCKDCIFFEVGAKCAVFNSVRDAGVKRHCIDFDDGEIKAFLETVLEESMTKRNAFRLSLGL